MAQVLRERVINPIHFTMELVRKFNEAPWETLSAHPQLLLVYFPVGVFFAWVFPSFFSISFFLFFLLASYLLVHVTHYKIRSAKSLLAAHSRISELQHYAQYQDIITAHEALSEGHQIMTEKLRKLRRAHKDLQREYQDLSESHQQLQTVHYITDSECRQLKGEIGALQFLTISELQPLQDALQRSMKAIEERRVELLVQDKLKSSKQDENNCVICLESPISVVLIPCGHHKLCNKCAASLTTCPLCRKAIRDKLRTF